ncbi:MAG: acetyl-CoA synthase subunit gamma [Candidatus Latescibacteria bacterium]|nr:acetyl-CoA synthase subunit gamma [Candidatus Latescibacterota bacterium]NIO29010.1 acetyl-CoA synthase subunit gamma [Candidatus Latescibacterota bacterium]NIO56635.1 acetyl-CoA synthase subunit gamma [Candidatus Latescibacterota bacterium]NIT02219.1 acetyl-CoA synthase subunit gamma [Candidatus Latescibacterota bacterium]NIT39104.1 acetyl-CoA synthase subunit gamma [Candidatus Latescibacterota bacterium]
MDTPIGKIPRVKARLTSRDWYGSWKVRWAIGRTRYRVPPGLYAVGAPTHESPVLVTANYKMSLDLLRSELAGHDAWIMVLDTKGINVWCAAGKGTFGTAELIDRIDRVRLSDVVSHRNLILPQLGATGVSAHAVEDQSGWRITYGPVRAGDLLAFLRAGRKATPEMRRVRFPLFNRLVLVPTELAVSSKYLLIVAVCFLALSGLGSTGYSVHQIQAVGSRSLLMLLAAYFAGAAVAPVLLPWLPGPAFSLKGAFVGLLAALVIISRDWAGPGIFDNPLEAGSWLLMVPAVASFLTMNYTGSSTYTSLSGVRREMHFAVPAQIGAATIGVVVWVVGRFI